MSGGHSAFCLGCWLVHLQQIPHVPAECLGVEALIAGSLCVLKECLQIINERLAIALLVVSDVLATDSSVLKLWWHLFFHLCPLCQLCVTRCNEEHFKNLVVHFDHAGGWDKCKRLAGFPLLSKYVNRSL